MYGYVCPDCGAYLDPGEKCDCQDERLKEEEAKRKRMDNITNMLAVSKNGQLRMVV